MGKKMGRPKIEVNWGIAENLASIQATGEEIAHVMGFSYDTLEKRIREEFNCSFTEWYSIHSSKGKVSLRRLQYKSAQDGSVPMQKWLGQQWLGQSDKIESENTNTNINAFEVVEYDED